jgi:hypothetical protein
MRNRAHCCSMCIGADQAHHKRHQEIAEILRIIFEICGEDWSIIPADEHERGRVGRRVSNAWDDEGEDQWPPGSAQKRKDKKEQKRLARAATRRRVITLEEIKCLESVLHPASSNPDAVGPRNPDEVDEIERHLRYNAQVYNTGHKRRVLKEFARTPDAEVDFESEMNRILEVLGVAELLKRTSKNHCLPGKELKHFLDSVTDFKRCVIEDLVLLKKDELEVRMRRAAYLRYANRASFDILEQRYAEKDWKTGEKFSGAPAVQSTSSGSIAAVEEEWEEEDEESAVDWKQETSTPNGTDLRHLAHVHKRIGSGGKLEDCVSISQCPAPTSARSHGTSKRRTIPHLRLVTSPQPAGRESSPRYTPIKSRSGNIRKRSPLRYSPRRVRKSFPTDENGWQSAIHSPQRVPMPMKRQSFLLLSPTSIWAPETSPRSAHESSATTSSSQESIPAPVKAKTQTNASINATSEKPVSKSPFPALSEQKPASSNAEQSAEIGHPPVEQKKAKKKKQREAERKARRNAERERGLSSDTAVEDDASKTQWGIRESKPNVKTDTHLGGHLDHLLRRVQNVENKKVQMADPLRVSSGELELEADEDYIGGAILPVEATTHPDMGKEAMTAENSPSRNYRTLIADYYTEKHSIFLAGKATLVDIPARKTTTGSQAAPDLAEPNVSSVAPSSASEDGSSVQATPSVVASNCRHKDWKKFARRFKVDDLSYPGSIPIDTCANNHTCPFEVAGIPDCPYHPPHCGHCDPRSKLSFVMYPLKDPYFAGPYNFPRAQKLITHFDADPRTDGKTMLVDDCMLDWIIEEGLTEERDISVKTCTMPLDLSYEVSDYFVGFPKGRLMRQTEAYRGLARKNAAGDPILLESEFNEIFEAFENGCGDSPNICFCDTKHEYETEMIQCTFRHCMRDKFHKNCVQGLGVDKVSKWYCPECERAMTRMAEMVLEEVQLMSEGLPLPEPTSLAILTREHAEETPDAIEELWEMHARGRGSRCREIAGELFHAADQHRRRREGSA